MKGKNKNEKFKQLSQSTKIRTTEKHTPSQNHLCVQDEYNTYDEFYNNSNSACCKKKCYII